MTKWSEHEQVKNNKTMDTQQQPSYPSAPRIIVSGGGTGGHIFPAISIANALKALCPDADILFVGAEGRMEMQRVPDAGYRIIGLPVAGFDRKHLWKNVSVLIKLLRSQRLARRIVKEFRPQVAVGVGGYASGPMLKVCAMAGIPTLIQEQNSYAGVTNKLLAKQAAKICVAYDGMERFFPAEKLILTGNPVRQALVDSRITREQAAEHFGLNPQKKTILILGGSLGARTLNRTMEAALRDIKGHPEVQFIWQTGRIYINEVKDAITIFTGDTMRNVRVPSLPNLYVNDFISEMPMAYGLADLVVSRAGAGSISEFCLLGKPVILVPSPNVAEDHQTKNALALVNKDAALYVKDADAATQLVDLALRTVADDDRLHSLSEHIARLALPDSADRIAKEVLKLIQQ
ncbi:MAG: undecaprenyldiphospho-muramoylpentapeptide beta-N-acetylglucosaminyltransferase [Candidatus Bacteroides intestinipullorum]|uniref:UDP-N-acetylglucosamine--N-acetylmuramyl-(pentapeptide) pyrophosphoryl-undecaprenol N-acetylglucosamine transferase n=1 Tax=Candidatus Bacteroides intestinipullorum TaxID=2838471 RepID=A0A9E2KHG2_9BACE|nr:undecaprenyldiphospho-muramoylpentapeptide beta-N-acetylglucosaminyltransferase [Candidatus Bacteroides intestinipullorum]